MSQFSEFQFTWTNFLIAALALWALNFLLHILKNILQKTGSLGRYNDVAVRWIRNILVIYELAVVLILTSILVLINPYFHGLIVGILLIAGFGYFKNYILGRIVLLENALKVGNQMNIQNYNGIISKIMRPGLQLKTSEGLQFISFSQLFNEGFMVVSRKEVVGFYNLTIVPQEPNEKINYITQLTDLLTSAPYLDRSHKPEFHLKEETPWEIETKVMVKEESHLYDLIALIKERGFNCKISKK